MPELPEVQTTVDGINEVAKNWTIADVWTDYNSPFYKNKDEVKNPEFFALFRKKIIGAKIIKAHRRAKNILIDLSSGHTILIHMKMTGHIMCGEYVFDKSGAHNTLPKKSSDGGGVTINEPWKPMDQSKENPLTDPFNRFIHFVITIQKEIKTGTKKSKHLVMSDMRKFGKITLIETKNINHSPEISHLGPEPLDEKFTFNIFCEALDKRNKTPIKQALMDQTLISGIGNIYSDEILWRASVHPRSTFAKIPEKNKKEMFLATKEVLQKGLDFGGDSMSDYRNIYGLRGKFQGEHKAYRKTGTDCEKKNCSGKIIRSIIGGRSGHFCETHQVLY